MKDLFSNEFLASQQQILLQYKEKILNKTHSIRQEITTAPEDIPESGDFANSYINQVITMELQEKDRCLLMEINEALLRLQEGRYGLCEATNDPICKKRLEQVPWTRFSLETAQKFEEQRVLPFSKAA